MHYLNWKSTTLRVPKLLWRGRNLPDGKVNEKIDNESVAAKENSNCNQKFCIGDFGKMKPTKSVKMNRHLAGSFWTLSELRRGAEFEDVGPGLGCPHEDTEEAYGLGDTQSSRLVMGNMP